MDKINSAILLRAESVNEKPMFRNAFISNRCIVPANGYYEWLTHEDKTKTKYLISVKEKRLFFMAWLDKNNTDIDLLKSMLVPFSSAFSIT